MKRNLGTAQRRFTMGAYDPCTSREVRRAMRATTGESQRGEPLNGQGRWADRGAGNELLVDLELVQFPTENIEGPIMPSVFQFLSRLIAHASPEMTLHDALRVCSAADSKPAAVRPPVGRYRSEAELRRLWHDWDEPDDSCRLTVILVLGAFLQGSLRELVQRKYPGFRLVLVADVGRWPGSDSFGDLALAAGAIGWTTIERCASYEEALQRTIRDPEPPLHLRFAFPACGGPRGVACEPVE